MGMESGHENIQLVKVQAMQKEKRSHLQQRHQDDQSAVYEARARSESSTDSMITRESNQDDEEEDELGVELEQQNHVYEAQDKVAAAVVSKLDTILLPFLAVFFLVNSLDKSNIGNSETAHFTRDAGLQPSDLNVAVGLFFGFFVALQPLGAILGRKYGMVRWVPSTMLAWGICTSLNAGVNAAWQLYLLRIVIGALEAGFYPTTVSYLSLFYTRYEFAKRLGIFYGQSAVAGALGGVISYVVFSMFPPDSDRGDDFVFRPWQLLFIIEGSLTVFIACVGFAWLPHGPGSAWFLTVEEREEAERRISRDREQQTRDAPRHHERGSSGGEDENLLSSVTSQKRPVTLTDTGITANDVASAVLDVKVWVLLVLNILSAIPAAAFSIFLPLVVVGLGFEPDMANLFVVPPFLLGAATLAFFVWWSDKRQERLRPILWGLGILLLGLTGTVMLPHHLSTARYVSLCVLMGGSFVASPLTVAWLADNMPQPGKRAVVLGINGWGNLAGVFSSLIFAPGWAPDYTVPFGVTYVLVGASFVGFSLFRWQVGRLNAQNSARESLSGAAELPAEARSRKWRILKHLERRWPHLGIDANLVMEWEVQHIYTL